MSGQGQSNYKGINAQAWAAMSLFLQYLRDPKFAYIQLEAPLFEDFNLVFNDGHKIICESKDHKRKFTYSNLRKILDSIVRKGAIDEDDEILIICTNLDSELEKRVENIRYSYFGKVVVSEFEKKGFTKKQIDLLKRTKFWKVQEEDNHLIVYSLFGELLNFWLPEDELEIRADSLIVQKIYKGSAKGDVYHREDILTEIGSIREKTIKDCGYFDDERVEIEKQLENLLGAIENDRAPEWSDSPLKALSSKPALMLFVFDRLGTKTINLRDWSHLWELHKVYRFSFSLSRIFENNINTEDNKNYILRFFKDNIKEIGRFYQHDFFNVDAIKIIRKILSGDNYKIYLEDIFEIVERLVKGRRDDIFYLKAQQDKSWEREETTKLIKEVYEKSDHELREKVYKLIIETFNLIEDDGEFSHYTPKNIFEILRLWLKDEFERRLLSLTEVLADQYDTQYCEKFGKKLAFKGWEHIGGTTVFSGDNYKVTDRHFIEYAIRPAILDYYYTSENKDQAWEFIISNCISKTEDVKKYNPDFLNRAIVQIVVERYKNNNEMVSNEAFEILKEFILSRKGIPHKSELIYQELKNNSNKSSDEKKWQLLAVSIDKYQLPVSVFVEEIISDLAKRGHKKARESLAKWIKNPKYYKSTILGGNIVQNIFTILENDFNFALTLFENFISSEYFINEQDPFRSYDVARLLYAILRKDHNQGLRIIKDISERNNLTKNQQILLCFGFFNYGGEKESDDIELLEYVFHTFIEPFLNSLDKDIGKIVKKLPFNQSREAFVKFAEKLSRNGKIAEALRIVKVFINDPDPYLPDENPDDPNNTYNEHQKILDGKEPNIIDSVRGWCAWVLMGCSVVAGRDYIGDIIDLTEQLTMDKNWYVKHMVCFTLGQLAQNRLTVLPNNREVLFFGKDEVQALGRAKRVEEISFNLLYDLVDASDNVKKALAKSIAGVFIHIRALNEQDALKLVNIIKGFPEEVIVETAPIFIFFAEFRKQAFKNWKWKASKYYNGLGPNEFDSRKFKKILLEVIDNLEPEKRWAFASQFRQLMMEGSKKFFRIGYRYLSHLSKEYNHQLFNTIYIAINDGIKKKQYFDKLYALYLKCLREEKEFYDANFEKDKSSEMSWWPSVLNEDILMFLNQQHGKNYFLEALDIITQFPKELVIYDSEKIISALKESPKTNEKAKTIVTRLFGRDPVRYYKLRKEWLSNGF